MSSYSNPRAMAAAVKTSFTTRLKQLLGYTPDWTVTIGLFVASLVLTRIHGFFRNFSLDDETIQFPFAEHERVPDWLLIVLSLGVPLVTEPIINAVSIRSWWDWHNAWLGTLLAWCMSDVITNIVKVTAGRPRPDLIDRCQPAAGSANAAVFGLVTSAVCTQTDFSKLQDGFRSFWSGHSSRSFAGLGFLYLYLAGKLHLYDKRGNAIYAWIALIPLIVAGLVAISRTMDFRHHPTDVAIGSMWGFTCAWFAYHQYFPSLSHPLSHRPYSPRIGNGDENAPGDVGPDGTIRRKNAFIFSIWKDGSSPQVDPAQAIPLLDRNQPQAAHPYNSDYA